MKNFIFLIFLLTVSHLTAQSYILDDTFGIGGTKSFPANTFYPRGGVALNGHYFLVSGNKLAKVNYDGSLATNFGTGGFITFFQSSDSHVTKIKIYNNNIYITGTIRNTTDDAFIYKLDENGNFDATFGTNGKAVIDFGQYEYLSDFVMEPSGKFYCVGSKRNAATFDSPRLIYFKINTNGSIDTSFDSNGYKSFLVNATTVGSFIAPYQDGFLIAGENKADVLYYQSEMMLMKVDTYGNLDTGFGTNGYKLSVNMALGGYAGIDASGSNQLYDGKLYVTSMWSSGFTYLTGGMVIFDVVSNQRINPTGPYDDNYFDASSDGLFVTGYNYVNCDACHNSFNLRKMTLDGAALDPNFQNNNVYNYSFPGVQSNCQSQIFIKDTDGKILIAGYSHVTATSSWVGFSMIRLKEGVLAVNDAAASHAFAVSPNPFDQKLTVTTEAAVKSIAVFDLPGRKISEPRFEIDDKSIDVDLSVITQSGTYLLRITTADGKSYTQKIIRK